MREKRIILSFLLILLIVPYFVPASDCDEDKENSMELNRSLYFTPQGRLTPILPQEFEIHVPSGAKEGYFGFGIIPVESAEYMEIGTFETGPIQGSLRITSNMVIHFPITANESAYFDLRVSLLLNGVTFAPQQEKNNEVADANLTIWDIEFDTENKQIPVKGNLEVKVEFRTKSEEMFIVSRESETFGINVIFDPVEMIDVDMGSDNKLRMDFKESFDVSLNMIFLCDLIIYREENSVRYYIERFDDPVLTDSRTGFYIEEELILLPGYYTVQCSSFYNEEFGNCFCRMETPFVINQMPEPEQPEDEKEEYPGLSSQECKRFYEDDEADTWDYSIYSMGGQTEGYQELKRGKSASCDIISVTSCRVGNSFLVNVTFRADAEDLARCEIYIVNRSFVMPELTYELGWEEENVPEVIPDVDCISSTDLEANGGWWYCDEERNGNVITFYDDLDDMYYGDIESGFEIFVIALDGDVSRSDEVNGYIHWDYAGYNVVEPELVGESRISIYDDTEEMASLIIDKLMRLGGLALFVTTSIFILFVAGIIMLVMIVKRSSRKKRYIKPVY